MRCLRCGAVRCGAVRCWVLRCGARDLGVRGQRARVAVARLLRLGKTLSSPKDLLGLLASLPEVPVARGAVWCRGP